MKNLTEGKPLKLILLFAIPLCIGQIFNLFYGIVDTRIVGSVLGDNALAAVGATTSISDMLLSFLNGFTNGCAIVIATYFGAKDHRNMKKAIAGTVLSGASFALLFSAVCLLFLSPILKLMNVDSTLAPISKAYIGVILGGLIASTLYNICAAVLRAVGDSYTPLVFLIVSAVLNIGFDLLFVKVFSFGVAGAAWATVLSQSISAVSCYIYMRIRYPELTVHPLDFKPEKSIYLKLLPGGLSMGLMLSFVNLGTLILQTAINKFDNQIIVAHMAARKITSMFMLPHSVLGSTLATFCGQNSGARKYARIRQGIRVTLLLCYIWSAVVIVASYTIVPLIVRGITATTDSLVIETATAYLKFDTLFYVVCSTICILRNSMQGFGDTITPIISSIIELVGKIVISFTLAPALGYFGIILAEPIVWALMVIPLIINIFRNPLLRLPDEKIAES